MRMQRSKPEKRRSIGAVRSKAHIGLKNLAYNMRRLVQLERLATAPPRARQGQTLREIAFQRTMPLKR